MIFVTGDTHIPIDISKLNTKNFPQQKALSKKDYVIILGDFGLLWSSVIDGEEKYWTKWLNEKKFTTIFVLGNHECYDRLKTYPVETWHNGKVRKISDSIYQLMNGEIFSINNKSFFVMGGANSVDKERRIEGISWWKEEIPSKEELEYGISNLGKYNMKVDYILTHSAPYFIEEELFGNVEMNDLNTHFNSLYKIIDFERWWCGHYHENLILRDNLETMYDKIMELV